MVSPSIEPGKTGKAKITGTCSPGKTGTVGSYAYHHRYYSTPGSTIISMISLMSEPTMSAHAHPLL